MNGPARPRGAVGALLRSFRSAGVGLAESALRGRNFRLQLAAGCCACGLAAIGPFDPVGGALLLACTAVVLSLEAANTALEEAVDLARPGPDEGARRAKDAGAGAVLAAAAGSAAVLAALAVPRSAEVAEALAARPWSAGGAAAAALAAGLLPWKAGRSAARDAAFALLGLAGLAALGLGAVSQAGTAGAAGCLAIAIGAAVRARSSGFVLPGG